MPIENFGGLEEMVHLTSRAFAQNERIPDKYTGLGEGLSPSLQWTELPEGTKSLALICDDPDAPTEEPWVHWVIYDLPPTLTGLPEGVPRKPLLTEPVAAKQGKNSWTTGTAIGYQGPEPPKGHGVHRYYFLLYALDCRLELEPGLTKTALLDAMQGHILDKAELLGIYEVR